MPNPLHRLVYYPMVHPEGDWQRQRSSGALDLWLKTADNVDLHSWWFPRPDARFSTLFLHGNAGNITHRIDHAEAINAAGSSVLVVDYRGYGKSNGRPTEKGLYLDADAGYDQLLKQGYAASQVVLHGESLGTAVATDLAARRPCAALVLEAPMTSLGQMAATVVPVIGPLLISGFNSKKKIREVKVPLLIVHGEADEIVPFHQGESLFLSANEPKTFW